MATRAARPSAPRTPIEEIAEIARELTGVQLSERHATMIQSRLQKRLSQLKLANLEDYVVHLRGNWADESQFLIGALTTHHTYFFREFAHFELLARKMLPHALERIRQRGDKTLRVWSAACSRGQEVYSLAMFLLPLLKPHDVKLEILGTDVDQESVALAKNGVFPWREVKEIPLQYLGTNWQRGTGEIAEFARAKESIRKPCRFDTGNLFQLKPLTTPPFDIIFCRNVYIYFNAEQVTQITKTLMQRLDPEGFLVLGISESLHGLNLPVQTVGPSVYVNSSHSMVRPQASVQVQATAKGTTPAAGPASAAQPTAPIVAATPAPDRAIRVLVVDDSPTVHTLLKQIFTKDQGFEIVGQAKNGLEAGQLLAKEKPDVVTLDIHMPEQNGIEYLQANYKAGHPPVVMVSSVSREDTQLASRALELGASDYVEKPALNNLKERADELRTKVRCAFLTGQQPVTRDLSLDKSFSQPTVIRNEAQKRRILVIQGSDRKRVARMLKDLKGNQPPCLVILDSDANGGEVVRKELEKESGRIFRGETELSKDHGVAGQIYFLFRSPGLNALLRQHCENRDTSVLIYGEISEGMSQALLPLKSRQLQFLLEDLGARNMKHRLSMVATDHSPESGFRFLSDQYLSRS